MLRDTLFSFHGRLNRPDWWFWTIVAAAAYAAVSYVATALIFPGAPSVATAMVGVPPGQLALSVALATLSHWPLLALAAKRAHDIGWSAWPFAGIQLLAAVLSYLPYGPDAVRAGLPAIPPSLALTIVFAGLLLVWLGAALTLGLAPGASGANRFGAPPRGTARQAFDAILRRERARP
jgi:uncharacterized membrane protein YhaH (DUF805 family)